MMIRVQRRCPRMRSLAIHPGRMQMQVSMTMGVRMAV
jgi:hypothetical protein